jgi:hypothetical protein
MARLVFSRLLHGLAYNHNTAMEVRAMEHQA